MSLPSTQAGPAPRRGRPRKFTAPSRPVTLTLPEHVIDALSAVDGDLSRAIVRLAQPILARRPHPPAELPPPTPPRRGPPPPRGAPPPCARSGVIPPPRAPPLERGGGVTLLPPPEGR